MTTIETIQRAERRAITLTKNGSADAEHARGSVYKLAGEQARRAETIRQRDAANRSARVCLASADAAEKDAERLSREARALIRDFNGSKVTQDKIDTLATSATERRSYAEAQRAAVSEHSRRAGKLTAQIARMPHGNRRIRRAAERASVKVRNAAARGEIDRRTAPVYYSGLVLNGDA